MGKRNSRKRKPGGDPQEMLQQSIFGKFDRLLGSNPKEQTEQGEALTEGKKSVQGKKSARGKSSPRKNPTPKSLSKVKEAIKAIEPETQKKDEEPVVKKATWVKSEAYVGHLRSGLGMSKPKTEGVSEKPRITKADVARLAPWVYLGPMGKPQYLDALFCTKVQGTSGLQFIGDGETDYVLRKADKRVLMTIQWESDGLRVKSEVALSDYNRKFSGKTLGQFQMVMILARLNDHWELLDLGLSARK